MKRSLTIALMFVALLVVQRTFLEAATVDPAVPPFESSHPYQNDADDTWVYDHGAPGFAFHFTAIELASDGDVVEILDADDNVLETIPGVWADGYLTVRIPTSVGKVRLVSNASGVADGFALDAAHSVGASLLGGSSSVRPTSIQFGPDGRLYVAQMDGQINAYTVAKLGPNNYAVTATEVISAIHEIPNHDDDGALNAAVVGRLLTGLWVEGTSANPVIFAASSDPRSDGDTNSGVLSRLTWDGDSWEHLRLVQGLPRSWDVHASNGLVRDAATNIIYMVQGGHTNQGGTSSFFKFLPEYALSGAVLTIDLAAIGESTYDLPTLDDPDRPGSPDAGDPFGGNYGANQGVVTVGGPVQIYAPGFRNPYDLELTADGRLYVTDNGPSDDLGGPPTDEGASGSCTSAEASPGLWAEDGLHYITASGYYGGHPNPLRGNPAGSPFGAAVPAPNPIECDYRESGTDDDSIASFPASTNGIEEYTPTNPGGLLTGNLFTVSWNGTLSRIVLTPAGDDAILTQPFAAIVGARPLDIAIPEVTHPFAGTLWIVDWATGNIHVFEVAALAGPEPDPPTGGGGGGSFSAIQTITPTLEVINDDGGSATRTDFTVLLDGDPIELDQATTGGSGLNRLTLGGPLSLYDFSFSGDCAGDGFFSLSLGDEFECDIVADDLPLALVLSTPLPDAETLIEESLSLTFDRFRLNGATVVQASTAEATPLLTVTMPTAAVPGQSSITVQVTVGNGDAARFNPVTGTTFIGGTVYNIQILDAAGNPIESFSTPIELSFLLPDDVDADSVAAYFWDRDAAAWTSEIANLVNGRFVVSTSHLTTFALFEFSGGGGFNGPLPASGIALATAEGGTITQLRRSLIAAGAEAVFVTENGRFVGFLPEAPDFVNEDFLELFGGSVPAGRAMIVSLGR